MIRRFPSEDGHIYFSNVAVGFGRDAANRYKDALNAVYK